jgi:predicted aspartyl protease
MPRSPVPGEAAINPHVVRMAIVQNVALGSVSDEVHLDAVIDTGATMCIVPPIFTRQLGFDSSNRLRGGPIRVIGGSIVQIDEHRLEWVRAGSAAVYDVQIGVCTTFAGSRNMLLGLNFIKQFRTILDFDAGRVLFRSRK